MTATSRDGVQQVAQLYHTPTTGEAQAEAFRNGDVPVAVYGLGKMGLPLASVYADVTGNVTGVDVDPDVVDTINQGDCHVENEPGLPDLVDSLVDAGALTATTDTVAAAANASIHVIIVPTLVDDDNTPDLSVVTDVATDIAHGLDPGDLVVLESTVPPGTCRTVLEPLLEDQSSLDPSEFGLAFCPERTSSGRALRDVRGAYPKVVGGVDAESTRAAELVYTQLVDNDVITVSDATTAEAVKVFEGLYRDVNIGLANELARFTDELEIDVREAIDTANTQPFCDIHTPGPGVGGHCIPYYPYFVLNWLQTPAPLLATARQVNDEMPGFVADQVLDGLQHHADYPDHPNVLVLGLTYRAGVAETRASPARGVCEALTGAGATVYAADPMVDADGFSATHVELDELADLDLDAAVLVTAHEEFETIDWTAFDPLFVVDSRDVLDLAHTDHEVYTIGGGVR